MPSIIRYKFKADRDFKSVQFEGTGCSVAELKRLIEKSEQAGSHRPRDDYDLFITDPGTHEEYKDGADVIPSNASVIVSRRLRGSFESLTPSSNRKPVMSFDETVKEVLLPALAQSTASGAPGIFVPPSVSDSQSSLSDTLVQLSTNAASSETTEDERIKEVIKTSQSRYLSTHRSTTSQACHNCQQTGHLRNQCPLLLQPSSIYTNGNGTKSSSDGARPGARHNHNSYGNRSHYRGTGRSRQEPVLRTTKGIPRDGLITISKPIPGALVDQHGATVIPRQMAELLLEKSEQKANALAERARQFQEKGVLPSASSPSTAADDDTPPDDLLCLLCKQVYRDAVIAPCCRDNFCDECIRTALIESDKHQCPNCHRQHAPIDQIEPNLPLRKCVSNWLEDRQRKISYPNIAASRSPLVYPTVSRPSRMDSQESDQSEDNREVVPPVAPPKPVKTAPIIIRMQRQEEEEDQPTPVNEINEEGTPSNQDDSNAETPNVELELSERTPNTELDAPDAEDQNIVGEASPSHIPTTHSSSVMVPAVSSIPSVISHHPQPHMHHEMMYPAQLPHPVRAGFYPIHHHPYGPPMPLRYPLHHYPPTASHPLVPVGGYPYYPSAFNGHYVQPGPLNAFHPMQYEATNVPPFPHPGAVYAATLTSTLISHQHAPMTQPQPESMTSAPSSDSNRPRERYPSRRKRSTSRRRRSRSYSSHSSSDSRRDGHRYHRQRATSRHRRRTDTRRRSPARDHRRRPRRSPRASLVRSHHSSKQRRTPPRPTDEREKHRSPRPPPTIEQSMQRTIVYLHESSTSKAHSDDKRDRSQSRQTDDVTAPSGRTVKILSSRIEPAAGHKSLSSVLSNSSNKIASRDSKSAMLSNESHSKSTSSHKNKRKERDEPRKRRRSNSSTHRHEKDKSPERRTVIERTASFVEVQ